MIPLINGRSYDHSQIRANVLGVILASISEINYVTTQEKEDFLGAGVNPVERGHGAKVTESSMAMSMVDIERIRDATPTGDLLDVPAFDIPITFLHPTQAKVVTHVLKNVEFTDDGVESSQGDTTISRTFAIKCSHVKYR